MAIDRETSFSVEKQENIKQNTMSSITSARAQRREDIKSIQNGGGEEYIKMLREQVEALEKLNNLRESDLKKIKDANKLLKEQEEFQLRKDNDYEKYLKNLQEVFKVTEQLSDVQYSAEVRTTKNIDNQEKKKKAIKKIEEDAIARQRVYNALLKQANEMIETNKEASKSQLAAFTEGIHNLKDEVGKLAVIKGVGDITQGLFDKNSSSNMYNVYRNTSAQLGISNSEFNQFKNDLNKQLMKSDNFFNFGWKDTADYLNKLGELNITSQEMAEQQYLAVIQGSKYLGLQTETQAKILKVARDTGNMDLLTQTNETIVKIMNAQLGVSKEQLNQIANSAIEVADIVNFLGGDGASAYDKLMKIESAVTSEYGSATAKAAENILKTILANPSNNQYLNSGFFGTEYSNILNYAQNGQADEAYKRIIESVRNSQATRTAGNNVYAMEALGVDSNIMAIANASGSMDEVNRNMANINNSSSDIAQTIREFNQDWSDKIINAGSNILSMLPFSQVLTLQNVYYALATVELLTKLPVTLKIIGGLLKSIAFNTNKMAPGLDGTNPQGLQAIIGTNLSPLAAIAAGVASLVMFYNDATSGRDKADEWGTTKTAATIGGLVGGSDSNGLARTLKNAGKYALAGAAIGSFFPGIGNVAGWVIGGLIGLVAGGITGGIGGERIANGLDDMFGRRKDLDDTGDASMPYVPPSSHSSGSSTGRGEPISKKNFPWSLTSPFGYRGVIQTSAGPTNPFHSGIDLAHPKGTLIGANNAGIVTGSGTASDGANYVTVDSGNGYSQIYWHLDKPSHLKKGDHVNEGQLIGYMGMTGHATGPHLHFGMKKGGSYIDPINMMNSGTFYPTENGYTTEEVSSGKESEKLLESVISADTLSDKAAAVAYNGIGDSQGIINSVDRGFAGLNDKLEELSARQDNQEEIMRMLMSSNSSSMIKY